MPILCFSYTLNVNLFLNMCISVKMGFKIFIYKYDGFLRGKFSTTYPSGLLLNTQYLRFDQK